MLRVERIFESAGIQDELDAYNPLIPDGRNWKATMLIEYADPDARRTALEKLADRGSMLGPVDTTRSGFLQLRTGWYER